MELPEPSEDRDGGNGQLQVAHGVAPPDGEMVLPEDVSWARQRPRMQLITNSQTGEREIVLPEGNHITSDCQSGSMSGLIAN